MLKLPDFIIIGAMKSATSTLQDQLIHQRDIYMCEPKEPNFFSDDEQYAKGMEWYLDLFDEFPDDALLGEASTHYTKLPTYPNTITRIKKHLSGTRFIYVMRHPIDRLVSHYIHEWSMGNYKCDINEAIIKYPELVDYGRYSMQLKPYLEAFGKDNVLPVFFNRLINDSQSELERICRFIGLTSKVNWQYALKAKNISNKRIRQFPFYKLIIESNLAKVLRRKLVPKKIRNYIKSKLRMQDRPVISKSNLSQLEGIFNEDLEIISKWLGIDINCSNFNHVTLTESLEWVRDDD